MKRSSVMMGIAIFSGYVGGFLPGAAVADDFQKNIELLRSIPLVKGLEKRDKNEFYFADELKTIFGQIQDEAKAKDDGLNRGTHAKGSCFDGEFKVFSKRELEQEFGYSSGSINRIKSGVFSHNKEYPARIRFANGKGDRFSDRAPDVRSLSFSLDLRGDHHDFTGASRLDFSANSSPMFAVNNIHEFYELMKADRLAHGYLSYIPNPLYIGAISRALKLLEEFQRSDTKSYATESYWMNLPYTHGLGDDGNPKEIAKYRLIPCDGGIQREPSEGKADDYLQADIAERAMKGDVCFFFQVQLFEYKKLKDSSEHKLSKWSPRDWIENGGEEWPEAVLPFYTVGKLEIRKELDSNGRPVSRSLSCKEQYLNPRLHSFLDNMPIGSIARVRAEVEEYSRARRMK